LFLPAYSSNLASSDFFLFRYIKGKLSDYNSESREGLVNAITEIFTGVDQEVPLSAFESRVNWLKWVIKVRYGELHGVLGEAVVNLATIKHWRQSFKAGNLSHDDANRPARPLNELAEVISQFLCNEPFPSAGIPTKRLATSPPTIKEIVACEPTLRKLRRRWLPHKLSCQQGQTGQGCADAAAGAEK
jgi:hypothetical protein